MTEYFFAARGIAGYLQQYDQQIRYFQFKNERTQVNVKILQIRMGI